MTALWISLGFLCGVLFTLRFAGAVLRRRGPLDQFNAGYNARRLEERGRAHAPTVQGGPPATD